MKNINENKSMQSRRSFLGTTVTGAAAFAVIPVTSSYSDQDIPPYVTGKGRPNSVFGGVQIGAITFSYNRMPDQSAEATLRYCIESGVSSIELMGEVAERYAGLPPAPARAPRDANLTPQQQADYEASIAKSSEDQRLWRVSAPMTKFEEMKKMYNAAGVNIHIAKFAPSKWSDEEIDYAFNAAKALGARAVCDELSMEACERLAPFAEKHNMFAVFHNHTQFQDPSFSVDPMLALSPKIMLNFDAGHYFGTTNKSPCEFMQKYHDRILSVHLKDSTYPLTTHQVWGQGMTPLAEILLCVKNNKWPMNCDIEMVYPVAEWSDSVKEVRKCVNFCRAVLI